MNWFRDRIKKHKFFYDSVVGITYTLNTLHISSTTTVTAHRGLQVDMQYIYIWFCTLYHVRSSGFSLAYSQSSSEARCKF